MRNLWVNVRYRMGFQFTWLSWALAIYAGVMVTIFALLIKFGVINGDHGSLVYRLWALVFSQFGVSIRFREDFDFLLTCSHTRKEIFSSQVVASLFSSAILGVLILAEVVVVDLLNRQLGFTNIVDPFHFVAPYATDNYYLQFLFFFMLCACVSLLGMLLGSLFYRFGKRFMSLFWMVLCAIPLMGLPLLSWDLHRSGELSGVLSSVGRFFLSFDLFAATGLLFVLSLVWTLCAWLNIRRLPQH